MKLISRVTDKKDGISTVQTIHLFSSRAAIPTEAFKLKRLDYFTDEIEYLLGRFDPSDRTGYLTVQREGRGSAPRVERSLREALLNEVIPAYEAEKIRRGGIDWNDLAVLAGTAEPGLLYDVVIVDECHRGSAADDVFAVGARGTILHWDGKEWSSMDSGSETFLTGVWGTGPHDVYATGSGGTVLRWDGRAWTPMRTGTSWQLNAIAGVPGGPAFVVGDAALVLANQRPTASAPALRLRAGRLGEGASPAPDTSARR